MLRKNLHDRWLHGFDLGSRPTFANSAASSAICAFSSVTCHVELSSTQDLSHHAWHQSLFKKKPNSYTACLVAGSRIFLTRKVSYAKNSWMSGRVGQGEANQTIGRHLWGLHLHRWCELRCRVSPCSQLPRELNSNCQKLFRHFQSL